MSATGDDVRRAYAVFGLRAGAPAGQIRRRYKALARQWHPDRHARDARNQEEAASRMREINAAYHCLVGHRAGQGTRPAGGGPFFETSPAGASPGGRMSREQVESLVQALGSDGPIDWLLDLLSRTFGAFRRAFVALVAMACILRLASRVSSGGTVAAFQDPTLFLFLALLALLLLREWMGRRQALER